MRGRCGRTSGIVGWAAAAVLIGGAWSGAAAQAPLRVLFVGNSYTYYNNLPGVVERIAAGADAARSVRTARVTEGGATLAALWRAGEAIDSIRTGRFDVVVLQEQSLLGGIRVDGEPVLGEPDSLLAYARRFRDEAARAGAETLVLLTWAREVAPEQQAGLDHAYVSVARELGLRVIPAGRAWQRVRVARPAAPLYAGDGSHPSPRGTFVAAAATAGTLLGPGAVRALPTTVVTDSLDARGAAVAGHVSSQTFPSDFVRAVEAAVGDELAAFAAAGGYPATRAPEPPRLPSVPDAAPLDAADLPGRWAGTLAMQVPGSLVLAVEGVEDGLLSGTVRATLGSAVFESPMEQVRLGDGIVSGDMSIGMGRVSFRLAYREDALVGTAELSMGRPIAVSSVRLEPGASCEAFDPAWSPDGAWLVLVSTCDGNMDLYRVRPDGGEVSRLTRTPGDEHGPAWSPDGTRIAYAYAVEGARSEIVTMAPGGSDVRAVTANDASEWGPTWSPDGLRLAWERHRDGNADIVAAQLASGREIRLTADSARDVAPAWSPDGARVAFQTDREGHYAIYAVAPDGSGPPRPLVSLPGAAVSPDWSPAGDRLVFAYQPEGEADTDIWIAAPGGEPMAVTANDRIDFQPTWSPDGEWIAFMVRGEGGWSVWVVRPDGSDERRAYPASGG